MMNNIVISYSHLSRLRKTLKAHNIKHGPFIRDSKKYYITIKRESEMVILLLSLSDTDIKLCNISLDKK